MSDNESLRRATVEEAKSLGNATMDQAHVALGSVATEAVRAIDRLSGRLQGASFDELLADARQVARSNPGLFLLGSAVVGFGLVRFLKMSEGASRGSDFRGAQGETSTWPGTGSSAAAAHRTEGSDRWSERSGRSSHSTGSQTSASPWADSQSAGSRPGGSQSGTLGTAPSGASPSGTSSSGASSSGASTSGGSRPGAGQKAGSQTAVGTFGPGQSALPEDAENAGMHRPGGPVTGGRASDSHKGGISA